MKRISRTFCRAFTVTLLLVVHGVCSAPVYSQLRLTLGKPDAGEFPTIHIPVNVQYNSSVLKALQPSNFNLQENFIDQSPLLIDCTNEIAKKIYFVFLVDVSLSMGFYETSRLDDPDSIKWITAKNVLVQSSRKLRPADEAMLISFAATPAMEESFTPDKTLIEDAVAGLGLRSGTAIYEALEFAVSRCAGITDKKVIILLTDGSDQLSIRTREQAIATARNANIPVYSIGLGVVPDTLQPLRNDMDTLRRISSATGGQAHYAPSSAQLDSIFSDILESIYNSDCLLTYTTTDTCRQGESRRIDVRVTVDSNSASDFRQYAVPDFRSRSAANLAVPTGIADDQPYEFPLLLKGELRAGETTNFEIRVTFDPALMTYDLVRTNTPVLFGQPVTVVENPPGTLTLTGSNVVPAKGIRYGESDTVLYIRFLIPHQEKIVSGQLGVDVISFAQNCPAVVSGSISPAFKILGCPGSLVIHLSTPFVFESGTTFTLPVQLRNSLDMGQSLQYSFELTYDTTYIHYVGLLTKGTISTNIPVNSIEFPAGTLTVTSAIGMPADTSGMLLQLLFRSERQKESHGISLSFGNGTLAQSCLPAVQFQGGYIQLNGVCEQIVTRKNRFELRQNHPNPVSKAAAQETNIEFSVMGTDRVLLEVFDAAGMRVATLVDESLPAGTYIAGFSPTGLPHGMYVYALKEGSNVSVRKMLWIR